MRTCRGEFKDLQRVRSRSWSTYQKTEFCFLITPVWHSSGIPNKRGGSTFFHSFCFHLDRCFIVGRNREEHTVQPLLPLLHHETGVLDKLSSVQFSRSVVSDSLRPHESQHARPPCPSPTPGVHPDSRPLSQWYHPAISSSVVPFSCCPQSLPASESFPISQLFTWGG